MVSRLSKGRAFQRYAGKAEVETWQVVVVFPDIDYGGDSAIIAI